MAETYKPTTEVVVNLCQGRSNSKIRLILWQVCITSRWSARISSAHLSWLGFQGTWARRATLQYGCIVQWNNLWWIWFMWHWGLDYMYTVHAFLKSVGFPHRMAYFLPSCTHKNTVFGYWKANTFPLNTYKDEGILKQYFHCFLHVDGENVLIYKDWHRIMNLCILWLLLYALFIFIW